MRARFIRILGVLWLTWAAGGCFVLHQGGQPAGTVTIEVESDYRAEVRIEALRTGTEVWNARVRPFQNTTFEVKSGRFSDAVIRFRLQARDTGQFYLTNGIVVGTGDVMTLRIESQLDRSWVLEK